MWNSLKVETWLFGLVNTFKPFTKTCLISADTEVHISPLLTCHRMSCVMCNFHIILCLSSGFLREYENEWILAHDMILLLRLLVIVAVIFLSYFLWLCLIPFSTDCLARNPLKEISFFFCLFCYFFFRFFFFLLSILTFAISFLQSLFCQLIKSVIMQWVTHLLHTTTINFIPHSHEQQHTTLGVLTTLWTAIWYGWIWRVEKKVFKKKWQLFF